MLPCIVCHCIVRRFPDSGIIDISKVFIWRETVGCSFLYAQKEYLVFRVRARIFCCLIKVVTGICCTCGAVVHGCYRYQILCPGCKGRLQKTFASVVVFLYCRTLVIVIVKAVQVRADLAVLVVVRIDFCITSYSSHICV